MLAMILETPRQPLALREIPIPEPQAHQVVVRVNACAICRTDLHVADGELADPKLPLIPGHQIVGRVSAAGEQVEGLSLETELEFLGWVEPAAIVRTVSPDAKTSATKPSSQATRSMEVTLNTLWPIAGSVSQFLKAMPTCRRPRCFARGLLDTALSEWRVTPSALVFMDSAPQLTS